MFTPKLLLVGLAAFMLILMLPALIAPKKWQKAMKPFLSDKDLTRMLGLVTLIIGFIFLSVQWKLSGKWLMIIPILGWLTVLKGILFLWFPEMVKKMHKKLTLGNPHILTTLAAITIIIAAFLIYYSTNILELGLWEIIPE